LKLLKVVSFFELESEFFNNYNSIKMKTKLLNVLSAVILFLVPNVLFGQAPNLGAAADFALFTAAGAINNTGTTVITGDIGTNVGAFNGFPPGIINGQTHVADAVSAQAASDLALAYGSISPITCGLVLSTTMGSGQLLTPNVYCLGAASTLNGELTLDAQNNPNAIFIFKIDGAFATSTNAKVTLINGANYCNIYWQINGMVTLANGTIFKGNILANGAISLLGNA
jgi:Ice-binding-like